MLGSSVGYPAYKAKQETNVVLRVDAQLVTKQIHRQPNLGNLKETIQCNRS